MCEDWFADGFHLRTCQECGGTRCCDTHNYTVENTPTETQTFTLYGLLNFNVEYWNGSAWVTVPGGSVTANNKVWRKFTFSPITTSKIRVYITAVPDAWS